MTHKIKTYSSYIELATAQGDFIPMHGETVPSPPFPEKEAVITEQGTTMAETEMKRCNESPKYAGHL